MKKLIAQDEDNTRNTVELVLEGTVDETQWTLIVESLTRDTDFTLDLLKAVEENADDKKAAEIHEFTANVELMARPVIETEEES